MRCWLLMYGVVALTACSSSPKQGEPGGSCFPNSTCQRGVACVDGTCRQRDGGFGDLGNYIEPFGRDGGPTTDGSVANPTGYQTLAHIDYRMITAAWGSSNKAAWAVGRGGRLFFYDGRSWAPQQSPTTRDLWGIWGSGPSDIYAVGASSTILHYDGSAWTQITLPAALGSSSLLKGVHGTGANDVWVISSGSSDSVLHFDGTSWTISGSGWTNSLALFAIAPNDVWVTYGAGEMIHYDGFGWTAAISAPGTINALWGQPPAKLIGAGSGGNIHTFDGTKWSTARVGTSSDNFTEIWGRADQLFVAARSVYRFDGNNWQSELTLATGSVVGGQFGDEHWVFDGVRTTSSATEVTMHRRTGSSWSLVNQVAKGATYTAVAADGSNAAWVAHSDGIVRCESFGCQSAYVRPSKALWAIHRLNKDVSWAVGTHFALFDGTQWIWQADAPAGTTLFGVWGASASQYWSVGTASSAGVMYTLNGSTWVQEAAIPPVRQLRAIWGADASHIWAVGESSTAGVGGVLFYDGKLWSRALGVPQLSRLHAVHGGSETDVWVAGEQGSVAHFNGSTWQVVTTPITGTIWSLFRQGNLLYAISDSSGGGALHSFDGANWKELYSTIAAGRFYDLDASADTLWMVGASKQIVRSF